MLAGSLSRTDTGTPGSTRLCKAVEKFRIFDKDPVAGRRVGYPIGQQVKQDRVVGFLCGLQTWVGPVAAPHQPFWSRFDKGLSHRAGVGISGRAKLRVD